MPRIVVIPRVGRVVPRVVPFLVFAVGALGVPWTPACGEPQTRPAVVPTPAVVQLDEVSPQISAHALWVAYAGAEGAGPDVKRTRAEARQRADMLAAMARGDGEGEDFWSLVSRYSDRPALADAGPVGRPVVAGDGTFSPAVEKVAFRLETGQVSRPIETPAGFVIVQRTPDPSDRPAKVAAKHILISYKGAERAARGVTRTKDEALALAREIHGRVSADVTKWDTIADEHTDEPGAQNGGDLGVFGPGQMVPAFERAAFGLQVGEVSEPIESPFGFHVIRRYK